MLIIEGIVAVLILALDLITKALVDANMTLGQSIPLIENVLSLTYVHNTGAAFSMMEGKMTFFYIITPLAFIGFSWYLWTERKNSKMQNYAIVLILAGMIGNFVDRVVYQYVRDFIATEFIRFPVFNVADISLCVGTGLFILYLLLELYKEYKTNKKNKAEKAE